MLRWKKYNNNKSTSLSHSPYTYKSTDAPLEIYLERMPLRYVFTKLYMCPTHGHPHERCQCICTIHTLFPIFPKHIEACTICKCPYECIFSLKMPAPRVNGQSLERDAHILGLCKCK